MIDGRRKDMNEKQKSIFFFVGGFYYIGILGGNEH